MSITRRRLLKTGIVGMTTLAGCTSFSGTESTPTPTTTTEPTPTPTTTTTPTPTPEPALYEPSNKDQMLLSLEAFPDGWSTVTSEEMDEAIDTAFVNENETAAVWIGVEVFETVAAAQERYEGAKERTEPNEYSLADEAFWGERTDAAFAVFRHSNAFGQCWGRRASGTEWVPAVTLAQDYAQEMFGKWQTI